MSTKRRPPTRSLRLKPHSVTLTNSTCLFLGLVGAAAFFSGGCTSHTRTPINSAANGAAAPAVGQAPDPAFQYSKTQIPFENHTVGQGVTPRYSEREISIPSIGVSPQGDRVVTGRYFRSIEPGPHPLVIALPIYARFTYPAEKIGRYIQRHSDGAVHVFEVDGKNFLINWYSTADTDDEDTFLDLFRQGAEAERLVITDLRRLIDWAEQQPEIDGSRVAIVGFSRSAIVAGTLATQEPRLAATALVVGGAKPHTIIARCGGKRTSAAQRNAERTFGWSRDELEDRLEPIFSTVDASNYPGRVDPRTVLMIEAAKDSCITEPSRKALFEAMGRPELITLNYGHRKAFLSMTSMGGNWMCDRIYEFLDEKLLGGS